MRLPTFRFTLWQLTALIAVCAMSFALLRWYSWIMLIATAIVLRGFAYDRARGGSGILGAMLAGIVLFVCFLSAFNAYLYFTGGSGVFEDASPGTVITFVGLLGLSWGAFVGLFAWIIVFALGHRLGSRAGRVAPPRPATGRGGVDCRVEDPAAGGRRP
jgi:hypothetical protein